MKPSKLQLMLLLSSILVILPASNCYRGGWSASYGTRRPKPNQYAALQRSNSVRNRVSNDVPAPLGVLRPSSNTSMRAQNDQQVARLVMDFTMKMSRKLAVEGSNSELFSPISITGVTNMLALGAKGETQRELGKLLKAGSITWNDLHSRFGKLLANLVASTPVDDDRESWRNDICTSDDDYYDDEEQVTSNSAQIIRVTNAVFHGTELPVQQQYIDLSSAIYGAENHRVNFRDPSRAAAAINQWVNQATAGKIRQITNGQFSADTNLVLASALYFKGKWRHQFNPLATRARNFYPDGITGPAVSIPMMSLSACLPYYNAKELQAEIIGLPYRDDLSTMYVIMPYNSTRRKIRSLQSMINAASLDGLIGKMKQRSASLMFPKMHLANTINLQKPLRALGVRNVFTAGKADLGNMVNAAKLQNSGLAMPYVNEITHKLDIAIDEEGTEGAAATVALIDRIGSMVYMTVNSPFLMYIRHEPTRLPLFYGPVFDPRA